MPAAEPVATAPVSSPAISHSTMAAVAPAAKPIPVTESVTHEKKAALVANEPHKPAKEEPPPEPVVAPIVLAASAPVERHEDEEPDVAAPSAPQLAMKTTPTLPGISIPTTTSAPKLAAPISKPLTGGTLVQRMAPLYPRVAMSEGIEGQVQLRAVITTTGAVENVRSVSGHPLLVQAAMEAVRHWKYDPFRSGGVPLEGEVTITLNFKIPR
jgi:protein TonB